VSGKPSLRSRLRPAELVGISAVIGAFVGIVVGFGTREWLLALEFAGISFVVALVVTAMLLLAATPENERPDAERPDAERPEGGRPEDEGDGPPQGH
jgi:peptidoglycan/LPS O-acetylase OafA/YrhL